MHKINISEACKLAKISRPTFYKYNQKPRRKQRGILRAKTFTWQSFVASYGEFTLRD